jgi:phytoene synthase
MTDLDHQVRVADPDRWLASRFVADEAARADLIALYACEAALAAIPAKVSQPLLAEMRLTWWAEQMDGVFSGEPRRGHPVLEALALAVARRGLDRAALDGLIEARVQVAHKQAQDVEALYVAPMGQAARVLAGEGFEAAVAPAGRMRGLVLMGRADEPRALRREANRALRALPAAAFPAVAAATLLRADEPEPVKRLRLTWAVLRGRL